MEKSGTKNQSIAEPFREKTERKIMGRAKIIYTVDPDHFKADTMEQFILGGMDIARCVCMQKEKEEQSCFVKQVGDFFKKRKKPVEIMLDLSDRTEADWEDTSESFFEIAQSVKVILMPFFEKPERRKEIRDLLKKQGGQQILLITKVENDQMKPYLDAALREMDGIMVGKGVEPSFGSQMMQRAWEEKKILVTATQMLNFRKKGDSI